MKPLGSGPGLGGSSPGKGTGNHGYGWTTKETDLDDMLLLAPEPVSPGTTENHRIKHWSKNVPGNKEEISEASLSEGFTFPPREPPRPGQFSNIPRQGPFAKPLNTESPESCQNLTSPSSKGKSAAPLAIASPLDLPELCLPGKLTNTDSVHGHSGNAEVSQQLKFKSKFFIPPGGFEPNDLSGPRSRSPKNAEDINQMTKLLSPPKLTSSPSQSRYNDLPTITSDKAAPRMRDGAYHVPRQASHTKTISPNQQRQSPPSTCGDLELPAYRSSLKSRHQHHKEFASRSMVYGSAKGNEQLSRHRSRSLASSNISKKRSRVHKRHSKPGPERKKLAMQQVAQYWNECLQITDEETSEACREIQRLQDDIQCQESELEKSRALLNEKDTKLCEVEKLYKALLEEDTRVLGENTNLNLELISLRQQLSEEKKRREIVNDKHRAYRSKLNEAIKEQQNLFSRSRAFYQETMDQLRKQGAGKTSISDVVDKALENSHKKREEMKKCLEEYRMQADKEIQQKDRVISELKEKLNQQETLLAQEKLLADNLRTQAREQGIAQQCVQTLEAKVNSLMAHHVAQNEQRESDVQLSAQTMDMLNSKLDSLITGGNLVASNMLSRDDLELQLSVVEKNIIERVSPLILSLENGQSDTANAMTELEASIRRDLDHIKDEAIQVIGSWEENKEENGIQFQEMLNHIRKLNDSVKKAEKTCGQIEQKFDALAGSEQSSQRATNDLLQDFTQRFLAREVKLDDLECRLQQAYEGFTKEIEAMLSGARNNGEETTNLVRSAATELRSTLEQGFGQERERSTQLLQGNENIVKVLTAHLDEHKQLTTQTDHKTQELQATLESEREAAAQLTRKIQALEQKAQESEVLRNQWLRDIQTIDTTRSQLEAIRERIPQVESYDKKLERIVEINKSIQSSANYLAEEREWIQQELTSRFSGPVISEVAASWEIDKNKNPQTLPTESGGPIENRPPAKEEAVCRKVTVHSPDPCEGSPSPPPTVMQEQKRRREITQLRSILKSNVPSGATEVESGIIEGSSTRPQANNSKPGHSLNGSLNKAGSASSKEMVAEIRSRLLRHDWSFPTVADFERDIQLAGKKRQTSQVNPMPSEPDDSNYRDVKKPRTECCIE
ncbi:hypothetical protein V8C37DRAFT_381088 [Trichoderma ceciliae]